MKKILILIVFFVTSLVSCTEKKDELIDFLNANDCYVYLCGNYIDDNYGMENYKCIVSLDEIDINGNFCVIIDVPNYLYYIDVVFIDTLYDILEYNNKSIVMFYNAKNYDFLKGTKFANDKDYYNNVSLIKSYDNFYGYIKESDYTSNVISLKTCLKTYAMKFRTYMGAL